MSAPKAEHTFHFAIVDVDGHTVDRCAGYGATWFAARAGVARDMNIDPDRVRPAVRVVVAPDASHAHLTVPLDELRKQVRRGGMTQRAYFDAKRALAAHGDAS